MGKSLSVRLRPTQPEDLDFVLAAESAAENACYVRQWQRTRHQAAIASADEAHFIVETQDSQSVGYAIIQDISSPDDCLMLRRLVITDKGHGYGKQTLRLILRQAFEAYGAHRLWLDVKTDNHRAKALYTQLGFVYEGCLRQSVKTATGYESMEIMAVLHQDYLSQQHAKSTPEF